MRTAALVISAVIALSAGSAQAQRAEASSQKLAQKPALATGLPASDSATGIGVEKDGGFTLVQYDDRNLIEKYWPFVPDIVDPEIEDEKVTMWILSILPLGVFWVPYVMGPWDPHDDYIIDMLISALIHWGPIAIMLVLSFIPIFYGWLWVINLVYAIVVSVWFMPVSMLNTYDYGLRGERKYRKKKKKQKKKKRRRRRRSSDDYDRDVSLGTLVAPGLAVAESAPSYAF